MKQVIGSCFAWGLRWEGWGLKFEGWGERSEGRGLDYSLSFSSNAEVLFGQRKSSKRFGSYRKSSYLCNQKAARTGCALAIQTCLIVFGLHRTCHVKPKRFNEWRIYWTITTRKWMPKWGRRLHIGKRIRSRERSPWGDWSSCGNNDLQVSPTGKT
jgi:hypothetical protein